MGLFSSKKKTIVGTSVSRLIKDELLPNSIIAGMTRGILQGADIPGSIVDELAQGIATRAESMYRYSEGDYVFGSPSGDYVSSARGTEELLDVLTALEGGSSTVQLEYSHTGPLNILHITWLKLVRDHGYNPATNKLGVLTTAKGRDVFLENIQVEIPLGSLNKYSGIPLQQWGMPARSGVSPTRPAVTDENGLGEMLGRSPVIEVGTAATLDGGRVSYAWTLPTSAIDETIVVMQDSFRITNEEYDEAATFVQAKYWVNGQAKYWIYELGVGTYPILDALVDVPLTAGGNYFPFIHLRSTKVSMGANTTSTQYRHSVKMAKKLGIDYIALLDGVHENAQIGDIEQAFVGFMVPANTENALEKQYLFDFFNRMYEAGRSEDPTWTARLDTVGRYGPMELPTLFSEVIQDTHMKMVVVNSGIQRINIARSGVVGTHESGRENAPAGASYRGYHYFRRQTSPNIAREIRVLDLETRYQVAEGYFTASDGDGVNDILLIPLDRSITRAYGMHEREELYARSLHMVANSLVVQTIKWYQQGWFADLLKIIAVVMLIVSLGQSAYLSAALASAGSALAVLGAVLLSVLIEVAINMAIAFAFKLVAQALGSDLALLVAVIAAVWAGYEAYKAGGFGKSITAQAALETATGLVKGVTSTLMDAMKAIQLEMSTFASEAEDKMELLKETQALLDSNQRMNPLIVFGETPDNYYNRTVHSGNIGTIGFTAVHSYVDLALQLPKLSDTVEGF